MSQSKLAKQLSDLELIKSPVKRRASSPTLKKKVEQSKVSREAKLAERKSSGLGKSGSTNPVQLVKVPKKQARPLTYFGQHTENL